MFKQCATTQKEASLVPASQDTLGMDSTALVGRKHYIVSPVVTQNSVGCKFVSQ